MRVTMIARWVCSIALFLAGSLSLQAQSWTLTGSLPRWVTLGGVGSH